MELTIPNFEESTDHQETKIHTKTSECRQVAVENGKMPRPFWKEPLPSQLQDHQVIPQQGGDGGGVYDGDEMLTVQEMLKEKRRNESNYLQVQNVLDTVTHRKQLILLTVSLF